MICIDSANPSMLVMFETGWTMLATVAGALLLIGQASEAAPAPKAHWTLKADPAYCRLERQSVEPDAMLTIDTIPGSDSYDVRIVGGEMDHARQIAPGSLIFAPTHKILNGLVTVVKGPAGVASWQMNDMASAVLDDLADAGSVSMAAKAKTSTIIPIPNAAKAIATFRQCLASQLTDWGADPAQFVSGGQRPVASKHRDDWLSRRDLLAVMARSDQPDIDAAFRVGVSATGMIDDCRPVAADTAEGVTKAACAAVMNRPLFVPATDPQGHPVRGVATFRVILARRPS